MRSGPCRLAVIALVLAGASACVAVAGSSPSPKKKPYQNPTSGRAVALQVPGMHRARVRRNITYSRAGGAPLRLDVYLPRKARAGRLPAVLVGGPPSVGVGKSSGHKVGWAQLISASGLAAVAFDIRSDDSAANPHRPSTDVAAALRYVKAHDRALGVDGTRLCTLGFSLGSAPWHLWAAMREPDPAVRCNVVFYGVLDFSAGDLFIAPQDAAEFSALTYLRRDRNRIAPMLVAKAGRDSFHALNDSIDRFVAEARRLEAPVELIVHPTGVHAFDLIRSDRRARPVLRRALAFMRQRLLQR